MRSNSHCTPDVLSFAPVVWLAAGCSSSAGTSLAWLSWQWQAVSGYCPNEFHAKPEFQVVNHRGGNMTAFWCFHMVCTGWVMGFLTAPNVPWTMTGFSDGFYLNLSKGEAMDIQKGCWGELADRGRELEMDRISSIGTSYQRGWKLQIYEGRNTTNISRFLCLGGLR